jgi:hypothetical protein
MRASVLALVGLLLTLLINLGQPAAALAGPVSWHEVEPTADGRQWWDEGSLRISRNGMLTVLSRFQPAPPTDLAVGGTTEPEQPRRLGDLYVMEIDCGQALFRDTSVNGIPRWGAAWQPLAGDGLISSVVNQSCAAAGLLNADVDPTV